MAHVDLVLFTHERIGSGDPGDDRLEHHRLDLRVPESIAPDLVKLFSDNPAGDTSVHEDTVARFPQA